MLALLCTALLGLADAPRELHAPLRPSFARFPVSRITDAPPLARTAPAPLSGWREPSPLELGFELEPAPASGPWQLPAEALRPPVRPGHGVSPEFERVMRLYRSGGACTGVVVRVRRDPCL